MSEKITDIPGPKQHDPMFVMQMGMLAMLEELGGSFSIKEEKFYDMIKRRTDPRNAKPFTIRYGIDESDETVVFAIEELDH